MIVRFFGGPRFEPKRDLILIKILTPSLIPNGLPETESPFDEKSDPKFDLKRGDLILTKILSPTLIQTGSHFDPNSDPKFDTKRDLVLIKILTPV